MEITPGSTNAALINAGLTTGPSNPGSAPAGLSPLPVDIITTVSVATLPPQLLRPQVIEAVVLRNTLLPAPNGNDVQRLQTALGFTPTQPANAATTTATQIATTNLPNLPLLQTGQGQLGQGQPGQGLSGQVQANQAGTLTALFRIALQWQGKTFDVISAQPLPPNTPVQIQITARNELILRSPITAANVALNPELALNTKTSATVPLSQQLPPTLQQRIQQLIQPLVRENLPRQQPLTVLLPALRALIAPELQTKMPATLARAILNLWQSVLSPKQLQQPAALKQAVINSGSFFEANTATARAISAENPQAIPQILSTDLKAQIMVLLTLLKSRASNSNVTAPQEQPPVTDDDAIYKKPIAREGAAPISANKLELSADTLLQQLSKALEAGLSRIHLNQLDAVMSRHPSADPTQTVPTWVLELPMQTPRGQDQLAVRVEEHERKQDNKRYKQWLVQLGFDLHELGKLSATLSIVEHSVAATLWAEHAQTHRTVQRELTSLRKGLESVGVNVTEMQCRHGVPPERNGLLSQRLVDTHS